MLWALLATFAQLMIVLKIGGGLYLLWLAFKAGKSALRRTEASDFKPAMSVRRMADCFVRVS